jgi:hypothetical protein
MERWVDRAAPVAAPRRNGVAVAGRARVGGTGTPVAAPVPAGTPDVAAGPGPGGVPHRDAVSAAHDAIDFARALVSDGGVQTAGLAMLRGEVAAVARELRACRQEMLALRSDVDRMRWEAVRLGQFTRGTLVDRLAAKFAQVDAALRRRAVGFDGFGDA